MVENMINEKIISIFKDYEVETLFRAVYAITAWPSNRSYIDLVDTLNRCVLNVENNTGNIKIETYSDFTNFFDKINKSTRGAMEISEGFTSDVGEVKFYSNNSYKDIFVANGTENSYETCFLIDEIAKINTKFKSMWQEILEYENHIIAKLYEKEFPFQEGFTCPSEVFFENLKSNYASFKNLKINNFFKGFTSQSDQLYPFFSKSNGFPVFLPLLKETFVEKIEDEISTDLIKDLIWESITKCSYVNKWHIFF
ncbi:hypothetical protein ACSAHR_02430 [Pediococcus pentosaceus]|uniref:hypothetical protein n=1 Tax=Pediococcus pentosaceus TaxID=1255 RepID=UPI00403A4CF4